MTKKNMMGKNGIAHIADPVSMTNSYTKLSRTGTVFFSRIIRYYWEISETTGYCWEISETTGHCWEISETTGYC